VNIGLFRKFDETTLTFTKDGRLIRCRLMSTNPASCGTRDTQSAGHPMANDSADVMSMRRTRAASSRTTTTGLYGEQSRFSFYGPFPPGHAISVSTGAPQIQQIMVEPAIDQTRFVQMAYTRLVPVRTDRRKVLLTG